MASLVDLDDVKDQLSIEHDVVDYDSMLERFLAAAKSKVMAYVRRDLDAEFPTAWPDHADQAVRMLVAHWFAFREAAITGGAVSEVPFGFVDLLSDLRDLS
jgi:Phage gp6-like head-tail connector protein